MIALAAADGGRFQMIYASATQKLATVLTSFAIVMWELIVSSLRLSMRMICRFWLIQELLVQPQQTGISKTPSMLVKIEDFTLMVAQCALILLM